MQNITFQRIIKSIISSSPAENSIEIGKEAINNGFLKFFPGAALATFLYLITHCDERGYLETNPTIISSYLPESYDLADINKALKFLEKNDIIKFPPEREGDYTYRLKINFATIESFFKTTSPLPSKQNTYYNKNELRNSVLSKNTTTQQELYQALLTFVPPDENIEAALEELEKWLTTFEPELLQELIRRVNKWIEKYENPPEKAFHYLRGIIDDWYQKEIFNYKRLKHFDQLYRETRELAAAYGITNWQNVNPVHMETFLSWLTEDYPLSSALIKFAIKEAFRRKSGGHPSLKYIEENFIIPWKKAKIKTIGEAKSFLSNNNTRRDSGNTAQKKQKTTSVKGQENTSTKESQQEWEELHWDFDDFK